MFTPPHKSQKYIFLMVAWATWNKMLIQKSSSSYPIARKNRPPSHDHLYFERQQADRFVKIHLTNNYTWYLSQFIPIPSIYGISTYIWLMFKRRYRQIWQSHGMVWDMQMRIPTKVPFIQRTVIPAVCSELLNHVFFRIFQKGSLSLKKNGKRDLKSRFPLKSTLTRDRNLIVSHAKIFKECWSRLLLTPFFGHEKGSSLGDWTFEKWKEKFCCKEAATS